MFKTILELVFISFLFVGCNRQPRDDVHISVPGQIVTNVTTKSWVLLDDAYPIVCVGNQTLTKGELSYIVEHLRKDTMLRVKNSQRFSRIWSGMRVELPWKIVSDFIARASFSQEALRLGLKPSTDDLALAEMAISNRYANLAAGFNLFRSHYPRKAGVEIMIQQEAESKQAFQVLFSNSLDVADHEIDNTLNELRQLQAQSVTNNLKLMREAKVYSVAYNRDSRGGTSFADLPKGFQVESIEDAPANSFEDEETFLRATMLVPNGRMTLPYMTDSTIEMYVITNVSEKVLGRPRLYSGWRLYANKDLGYEVPDRSRLAIHMRELRNLEIVQPKLQELSKKVGVLFPQGFVWNGPTSPYSVGDKAKGHNHEN